MPFKLRLKKSRRHYDVVSKNVFVVSVELLDKAVVECSLSSDSNGQECLENVCQRIGLHQSDIFGLRFVSKWRRRSMRWLELEKPLKRQLDKYAGHSESVAQLSLCVMYYVGDVGLLFDEVARYHYFLQLKSDIVEGRIACNADQAVILAAYCLQAEFGNHDPTRHTFEYLSDFPLLPKNLCLDAPNLLSQVIATHGKMVGLVPAAAEQSFIQSAQQLDDYGVEFFPAKDDHGAEALFGVAVIGVVVVKHLSADKSLTLKWSSIVNLSNHKRCVVVEYQTPDSATSSCTAQFQMEYSDTAKYVWRLCVLQHKFYMKTRSVVSRANELSAASDTANWRSISMPNLQSYVGYETVNSSGGASVYTLHSRHLHGDPRAEYLAMSSGAISELPYEDEEVQGEEEVDEEDFVRLEGAVDSSYRLSIPSIEVHRGSCAFDAADLALDNYDSMHDHLYDARHHHLQQLSAEELSSRAQRLPTYRPAPDYDTAIRKYGSIQVAPTTTSHLTQIPLMVASNGVDNLLMPKSYVHYKNFVDLSCADAEQLRPGEEGTRAVTSSYDHIVHLLNRPTQGVARLETEASTVDPSFMQSHFVDVHRGSDGANFLSPSLDIHRLPQRPSVSTPDLTIERLSLRQQNNSGQLGAISRNAVVTVGIGDDTPQSGVVGNLPADKLSVSPRLEFIRPTLPTVVSSLDSKHSRPAKDVRCRSSSTQSAPDPAAGSYLPGSILSNERTTETSLNVSSRLTTTTAVEDSRCRAFERKLSEGSVFAEFAAIPRRRPIRGQIDLDCLTALMSENLSRNRFAVLPYDENRVHLAPTVDNRNGYINASHISVHVSDIERRSYVAAQGPLPNTAADFWRMVWELNARVIVMLTDVRDGRGADKCFQYWPDETDGVTNTSLEFGGFQVVRRFSTRSASFVTSSLVLSHSSLPKNARNVWHIQYVDWPDHGCPDVSGFLSFMDEIESVRRHDGKGSALSPTIVHCSAGVGRSGVTILSDVMIHALDHNLDLDVPKVLAHLRHQRMLFVQTLAQYKFVYAVLVQYLKNSRLI